MFFRSATLLPLLHLTHAASIISRSQSYPLSSYTLGSQNNLVIANHNIAPDGFNRSWVCLHSFFVYPEHCSSTTLAGGTFPGPIIAAQKARFHNLPPSSEADDSRRGTNFPSMLWITSLTIQCFWAQVWWIHLFFSIRIPGSHLSV